MTVCYSRRRFRAVGAAVIAATSVLAAACAGGDDLGAQTDTAIEADTEAADGGDETITLTWASFLPAGNVIAEATEQWAEEVTARTDGQVQFEFFWAESLLPVDQTMPGVGDGRADFGHVAAFYHPTELPLSTVDTLPFMTTDMVAQSRAIQELYSSYDGFRAEYEEAGLHLLLAAPVANNMVFSKGPLHGTGDLAGINVRMTGTGAGAFQQAGANSIAMPQSEVYEALQRGVLDATSAVTFEIGIDLGFHEVAPYIVDTGMGTYTLSMHVMNRDTYESLPDDVAAVIDESTQFLSDTYMGLLTEAQDSNCTKALDAGAEIVVWDEAETGAWRDATLDDLKSSWIDEVSSTSAADPADFLAAYETALGEHSGDGSFATAAERCAESAG